MGLVQSDVLAFVAKVKSDPRLKLIADKIKWVWPLYNQEIHILGKKERFAASAIFTASGWPSAMEKGYLPDQSADF
jgi:hypothetical protein